MDNQELMKLLRQLQDEIRKTEAVDEKGTGLLREMDGELHALLNRSQESSSELNPSGQHSLEDALYHFETTHPNLTVLIAKVMETLSNSGI